MESLDFIKENWAILIALFSVVVSFLRMENAVKNLKDKDTEQESWIKSIEKQHKVDFDKLETEIKSYNLEAKKIEIAIARLQTDVTYIKDRLDKTEK